ncbi:sugar phosphate isomerase/epimerase family protein [Microlunatus sagamiharensis]|nr:sugar phosphate isomerase/epimerase family protein [Microlunatus sagamiharensis]
MALPELVDRSSAAGLGGIGLWSSSWETLGVDEAARLVRTAGLRVSSVCRAGMFPARDDAAREAGRSDNHLLVEAARVLDAEALVVVCGAAVGTDLTRARREVAEGLAGLADHARAHGVRLAVEPMHPMMIADRSVVTSLREAVDLVETLDHPAVGLALDAYHVWWDAYWREELARAPHRLLAVQVSDWVTPVVHQLRSRGMPGEGVVDLDGFLQTVTGSGFDGVVEVEVLSDAWDARPADVAFAAALAGVDALGALAGARAEDG